MSKIKISRTVGIIALAIGVFSWAWPMTIAAQTSVQNAALARVADELRADFGPVRFHRDEEIEDRFIVRGVPVSVFSGAPKFYLVQQARFEISGGAVSERFSSLPTMYVALSGDGLRAYKLAGFEAAEQNFNRLVSESPEQKIITSSEAESRGLLCAEIVYGLASSWWVDGASSAQLHAAQHFFSEGHNDGLFLAQAWWKSFNGNAEALRIGTTKENDMFFVNLPVFWAPVEGHSVPEVRIYRIEVGQGGTCHTDPAASFRTLR